MPPYERLKRQLLELSIVTFVTVVVWIGYGVYAALTEPVATNVTESELAPLPPLLTPERFDPLRDRLSIADETLVNFPLSLTTPSTVTP